MNLPRAVLLALALSSGACFVPSMPAGHMAVGPATPHPNVVVAPEKAPGTLVLGPSVDNDFVIPATGSVREVPVHGWRATLEAAFHSAFSAPSSDRKLEILEARLSFAPAAVSRGATAAVTATIAFKARVLDGHDVELGIVAGTAQAKEANVSVTEAAMTDSAAKAVESLYEALTAELLAKN